MTSAGWVQIGGKKKEPNVQVFGPPSSSLISDRFWYSFFVCIQVNLKPVNTKGSKANGVTFELMEAFVNVPLKLAQSSTKI